MRVYIAGPMKGYPDKNFPAFFAAEQRLTQAGHEPFNPARNEEGDLEYEEYLRRDLLMLLECDGICLLPGWGESFGANLEYDVASALAMKVDSLATWVQ